MSTVDDEPEKDKANRTTVSLESTVDGPMPADVPPAGLPSTLGGRFVPLRQFARGGLGEVYVARDEELGREVALKTLQARHADEPRTRARFVREAEITGHLEHPGIVPVYGLGRSPDGRPYYAMRLIEGETLDRAIGRFHAADGPGRDHGERSVGQLRLLGCFLNICNAVGFAHSRGIVHRDLKPSNVMLGHHGETLVVDWGLAKALLQPDDEPGGIETPVAMTSVHDSDLTLPGSMVGTPAFMSPEQAAGRAEELGPTSDVYNLGATLYCILTGRAPFEDRDAALICVKIQRGNFPPPRAVARVKVAPALEAICLKAMALRRQDRYASARALAEDLQRWIAHQPVSAYAESPGERLARWSRRHRTWVQAGGAALLALLVVLALATALVHRAWKQEQAERLESQRLSTSLDLDKGVSLSEEGATGRGMVRLAHALTIAPPREAGDLRRAILANLEAWRRPISPLRETLPHRGVVFAVACSPDGRRILTGSGVVVAGTLRGEARLWDAASGVPLGPPLRRGAPVRAVAFGPDGETLLVAGDDAMAQLCNAADGAPLGPALGHRAPVEGVAFASDGRSFYTAAGRSVRRWSTAGCEPLPSLPDQPAPVHALAVSRDGQLVLTGDEDGVARLWDAQTCQPHGPPLLQQATVSSAAFSPDGKTVLTGSDAGIVFAWDTASGQRLLTRLTHKSTVYSIAFSPDGQTILTGSDDNTARLWDAATGQPLGSPLEHRASVYAVAFHPAGKIVVTGSGDATARLWGEVPGPPERAILKHRGRVLAVAYRPDGKAFVTGDSAGTARLWDARTFEPIGGPLAHPEAVRDVAFGGGGRTIATVGADGTVRLWDARTQELRGRPLERLGPATAVAFSPDGTMLLTGGEDANARLWSVATQQPLGDPLPQSTAVGALAFSPDGKTVLIAAGTLARSWDVTTRRPVGAPLSHLGSITGVAFRGDGRVVVTGGEDNTVRLWEAADGRPLGRPLDHPATVQTVAFSPDGRTIVSGCNDRRVRFWDAATSKPVGPPLEHRGRVAAVAFSPDGRTALSGGFDHTARLWPVPVPFEDQAERIGLWVEVVTGMWLDTRVNPSGFVQPLDDAAWHRSRLRLDGLGGPPRPLGVAEP